METPMNKEHPTAEVEAVDLRDELFNAMCNAQEVDTTMGDLADACVARLERLGFSSTKESDLRAENERLRTCPTPWCSREDAPHIWQDCTDQYAVVCPSCSVVGPYAPTESEAIDLWNARAALQGSAS